ncbi:plasmid stabilization protein [Candidatus Peregrinibacteria bacterium]|nr:MAG: plasmid stabilization protein [Candidatus Peregrinibacteria bacterium]
MPYKIIYTKSYIKMVKRFFQKHPEILSVYEKVLLLLERNPNHPSLRLHRLQGKLQNLYSISINMKYRIILYFIITEDKVVLVKIGNHKEVYGE